MLSQDDQASQQLPKEIGNFRPQKLSDAHQKELHDANVELLAIRNRDYKWRIDNRGWFGWTVMGFLIAQHVFLFLFIGIAYFQGTLCDYQWLIGTFFAGLMTETFLTANFFIKWLFTEIPYKQF